VLFKNTKLIFFLLVNLFFFSKKKTLRLIRRRTFTKLNGLHKKCTTQLEERKSPGSTNELNIN